MNTVTPNHKKLRDIIEAILDEQKRFEEKSHRLLPTEDQLYQEHCRIVGKITHEHEHNRMRVVHEAIFKVHRKISREHNQLIQKCRFLLRELNDNNLSEREIMVGLDLFENKLERIKKEHQLIEAERHKILYEHSVFINSFGISPEN